MPDARKPQAMTMRRVRDAVERALNWQDLVQVAKASIAVVVTWLLARHLLALPQPFLAPYAAMFLFESTVYRSLQAARQQIGAVGAGVLLGGVAHELIALPTAAIGVVVPVGLLLGRWRHFGSSGIWVAVTALLVIIQGTVNEPELLVDRLLEIALGAVVGLTINMLVFPPIYLRRPREATAGLARELSVLLRGIAASLREVDSPDLAAKWEDDARTVENHVRHAHQAQQWSDESARLNLRRRGERKNVVDRWQPAATALRRAWPHLRELTEAAYVITHEHAPFTTPDEDLRGEFADVLDHVADAAAEMGMHDGSSDDAQDLLRRADDGLRALEKRVDGHHGPIQTAAGLASLLLPTRKAIAELRGVPTVERPAQPQPNGYR